MADAQARLVISAQDKTGPEFARVKTWLEGLSNSAQGLGPIFSNAALGITAALAAAGGAVAAFRGIVDGVDALNDLKDATGSSIENLSKLERVAKLNGGTLDNVAGILVKFNAALNDDKEDSKVGLALKAIGLSAEELRRIDPAEALQKVAVAFNQFERDGNLARVSQALFGKSIREAAPYLKDLAEAGQVNATVTTEQADAAEKFNKQLYFMKTASAEAARGLVSDLIPSLSRLLGQYQEFKKNGVGIFTAVAEAFKGNEFVNDPQKSLDIYSAKLREIDAEIKAVSNSKGADFVKRDTIASLNEARAKVAALADSWRALVNGDSAGSGRGMAKEIKQVIDANALKKPGPAGPNGDAEFAALIDKLNKKAAATALELSLGRKLTESEVLQTETEAQLTGQKTKLTAAQVASVRQALAGAVANAKALEQQQDLAKTTKAITDLEAQRYNQLAALNEQAASRNDGLREELAAVGKTAEQLDAMATARLRDAAARQAIDIIVAQNAGTNAAEVQAMEQQLALLRESVGLRERTAAKKESIARDPLAGATEALNDYLKTVANAGESTRQAVASTIGTLENALTDALSGKKLDAKNLVDSILQEFVRLQVVKPLLASIFGGGPGGGANAGAASLMSQLFSGFGGFFANGGSLGAGKWGIAGEAGPELIKGPAEVVPMSRMPGGISAGGMPTIVQNITVNGGNRNELMAGMQQARRAAVADIQELQRRGRT